MRLWIFLSGLLVICSGCSTSETTAPPVEIHVRRLSVGNSFHVTWKTKGRFSALVFARGGTFRARSWAASRKGQKVESRGGRDVITSPVPTREFEAVIPVQFTDVGGDYPLMMPFSDGGIVFYTGHLDAVPIPCAEVCADEDIAGGARTSSLTDLRLEPAPGERVLTEGAGGRSAIAFKPGGAGAFAYFGSGIPVRRAGYSVLADPALPNWILFELDRYFPQLVALNSRHLGRRLESSPLILIPHRGGMRRLGFTHSGAVVGKQILLALFGPSWSEPSEEARENFLTLLAHETFHLWNSSLFHSIDRPGGRWLHEGSAEAFAYLGLAEIGAISRQKFIDLQTEALNRCLIGLSGTDLPSSGGAWSSRNHYNCGAIMQEVARRALTRSGKDLWTLWAQIFGRASSQDGFYTHDDFFDYLIRLAGPEIAEQIRSLSSGAISGRETALEPYFLQVFSGVGTILAASDRKWPDWYHRLVAERAISASVESDCGGSGGYFVSEGDAAKLVGGDWCRNIKDERKVSEIGGYSVWKEGVSVYDYILDECRFRNAFPVTPGSRSDEFELVCPRLPARPSFLRYQSAAGDPFVGTNTDTNIE